MGSGNTRSGKINERKVSVITPMYNAAHCVADAINSVLRQTHENLEMIIIDDHSTDQSIDVVKGFADKRIRLLCLSSNVGAGKARNHGIKEATGRYMAFLDADDTWEPAKLEKQLQLMEAKKIDLCYSSYFLMDQQGKRKKNYVKAPAQVNYQIMSRKNYIGCLTAIYDTKRMGKLYFPESRKRQDWGLWMKILQRSHSAHAVQEPLASYRKSKKSLSSNKLKLLGANYDFYRKELRYGPIQAGLKLIVFVYSHLAFNFRHIKKWT